MQIVLSGFGLWAKRGPRRIDPDQASLDLAYKCTKNTLNSSHRPAGATLWRYMSFAKFVALLDRESLFFSRADRLEDNFEGSLSPINKILRPQHLAQDLPPDRIGLRLIKPFHRQ